MQMHAAQLVHNIKLVNCQIDLLIFCKTEATHVGFVTIILRKERSNEKIPEVPFNDLPVPYSGHWPLNGTRSPLNGQYSSRASTI